MMNNEFNVKNSLEQCFPTGALQLEMGGRAALVCHCLMLRWPLVGL